ncbi:MAG: pseudouridine synthase, partial [Terracidiphilus sp.]
MATKRKQPATSELPASGLIIEPVTFEPQAPEPATKPVRARKTAAQKAVAVEAPAARPVRKRMAAEPAPEAVEAPPEATPEVVSEAVPEAAPDAAPAKPRKRAAKVAAAAEPQPEPEAAAQPAPESAVSIEPAAEPAAPEPKAKPARKATAKKKPAAEPAPEIDEAPARHAPEPEPEDLEEENEEPEVEEDEAEEPEVGAAPAVRMVRLQKILAAAGIASRRRAEELIAEGRIQVNGQVVTTPGAKADPTRDHIRVDGKRIDGPERHRYFMLNKPRGYVTTVSDPEGRPTVMEFFKKASERLYPVGRLDYLSEGLLVFTNDGELANQLTRAASGVEKTYLVKVAGNPTEEELDLLRQGMSIHRGRPGSGKVQTAPALVQQVRAGDNPWFEVVLIEGRNRELRKMFEEIGHFVEKIRRVGYGPLVLDQEPGNFRELTAEEVNQLRLAAEGKLKPRRPKTAAMLGKEPVRPAPRFDARKPERGPGRPFQSRPGSSSRPAPPHAEGA